MTNISPVIPSSIQQFQAISAAVLMEKEFPEPKWAVPGILPEGLSILAAKPKKGKSLLALNIALAITSGWLALGKIPIEQGSVLYLALEDTQRRLQDRMADMLQGKTPPKNLYFLTEVPKYGQGGHSLLIREIMSRPDLRLVIVDTWARFTPISGGSYQEDYKLVSFLKEIADRLSVPILLIHHQRKLDADDIMDTLLGSQGVTGAADTLLVLAPDGTGHGPSYAVLHVTGRDVEAETFALSFDIDTLSWTLAGELREIELTNQQKKILTPFKETTGSLSPKQIVDATGLALPYVKKTLRKLIDRGHLRKLDRGEYVLNDKK